MLEEKKHEDFYSQMLHSTKIENSPGVREDDEYFLYMKELIESSRTAPAFTIANVEHNLKNAIDIAAARERDSIVFYVGLKNLVSSASHAAIDGIIKEEAKHLAKLIGIKAKLLS